jgi:hypothetical protein
MLQAKVPFSSLQHRQHQLGPGQPRQHQPRSTAVPAEMLAMVSGNWRLCHLLAHVLTTGAVLFSGTVLAYARPPWLSRSPIQHDAPDPINPINQ